MGYQQHLKESLDQNLNLTIPLMMMMMMMTMKLKVSKEASYSAG